MCDHDEGSIILIIVSWDKDREARKEEKHEEKQRYT